MVKYVDKSEWVEEVLMPDESTPILGGMPEWDSTNMLSGYSNVPVGQLADRTRFLHDRIQEIEQDIEQGDAGSLKRDNNLSDLQDIGQAKYYLDLNLVDNTRDLDKPVSDATQDALDTKVDKVVGKGLSDENYTLAEKNKLSGIQAGAQVNSVTSVAGKTGAVTLNEADVGLGNVDNTADSVKNVASAAKLTTTRSISATGDAAWSVNFNGTGNVSAALTLANSGVTAGTYTKVTVDAKGRVTAGSAMVASDVPALNASKAQVLSGTNNVYVSGGSYLNVISWNNIGSISVNTSINLDTSLNHSLTATASLTLDAINVDPGKTGDIIISTPSAVTISWAAKWKFLGSVPNIGGAGETWVVSYKVFDANTIYASAVKVA